MQLGMIGLGRMGANMVVRLMKAGHACVVYDSRPQAGQGSVDKGATSPAGLPEFVRKLDKPSVVGRLVPRGGGDRWWVDERCGENMCICNIGCEVDGGRLEE